MFLASILILAVLAAVGSAVGVWRSREMQAHLARRDEVKDTTATLIRLWGTAPETAR